MKAEIITIGDEILLGQVVDTNSAWLGQKLFDLQIHVQQITSITDTEEHIEKALREASTRADVIICTGGLGPTKDDITKATAAKFFGTTLVHHEEVMAHVKEIFERFSRTMPDMNYGQADILANAEVLFNDWGTAPGMWVQHQGKVFIFLPGVPFEMKNLMEFRAIPKLQAFHSAEQVVLRYILTVGIGESHLAELIQDIEEAFPAAAHLAYLPKIGLVRLRLSVKGSDLEGINQLADTIQKQLITRIGNHVIATEDLSFEEVLIRDFAKQQCTLATAESCTGGRIASMLTEVAGASEIFEGAIVAYANTVKVAQLGVPAETLNSFGAVSEETVVAMAKGAQERLGTTYALATSGIAGPGGGSVEKPVGTVWIAVAGKHSVVSKLFHFHHDRLVNIERAAAQALWLLWNLYRQEHQD